MYNVNELREELVFVMREMHDDAITGINVVDDIADVLCSYYDDVIASGDAALEACYRSVTELAGEDPREQATALEIAIAELTK